MIIFLEHLYLSHFFIVSEDSFHYCVSLAIPHAHGPMDSEQVHQNIHIW